MTKLQNRPERKIYEIKLKGHLNESWVDWFDGVTFTHEKDGTTKLTGEIIDQAALHGLLKKIRDLGLTLLSVNQIEEEKKEKKMNTTKINHLDAKRGTAIIVGILFITATVSYMLGSGNIEPILYATSYLIEISANANQMVLGNILELVNHIAVICIPFVMFPIFRKHNEALFSPIDQRSLFSIGLINIDAACRSISSRHPRPGPGIKNNCLYQCQCYSDGYGAGTGRPCSHR